MGISITPIDPKDLPDWVKKMERDKNHIPLRISLKPQSILEKAKYLRYYSRYLIGCSFKRWLMRQQVAKLLRHYNYEVEEVPNPTRLNAYKDDEWFLIDVDSDSLGVMQFRRGDISGVASRDRPYWQETLELLRKVAPVWTPFNSLHGKGSIIEEIW